MNQANLAGRLGMDAEVIDTKNGNIMVKLVLATKDRDETDWHQIKVIDNALARTCVKLTKGQIIDVVGKIKTKKRIDKQNVVHYDTYIIAEKVNFHTFGEKFKKPNDNLGNVAGSSDQN